MATTTIQGYAVEVSDRYSDDGRVGCWVSKGQHGASLAVLEDFGAFDDGPAVPQGVIDKIAAFAEANGY